MHSGAIGLSGSSSSLVDYNRAGVPLLEIVTEPELRSGAEAAAAAAELRRILRYIGVTDGNMSVRASAGQRRRHRARAGLCAAGLWLQRRQLRVGVVALCDGRSARRRACGIPLDSLFYACPRAASRAWRGSVLCRAPRGSLDLTSPFPLHLPALA